MHDHCFETLSNRLSFAKLTVVTEMILLEWKKNLEH